MKLSEPKQHVIRELHAGSTLKFQQDRGIYRLKTATASSTVHPATMASLISMGLIQTSLMGDCTLTPAAADAVKSL